MSLDSKIKIQLFLIFLLQCASSSAQTIKPKCLDGNCKNKIGTFIYSDSSIYVGSFVDKLRSGQGKITSKNKSSYDGLWLNDKRNGFGVYIDSLGNKYEGNWVDDKENGIGKYTSNKGNLYEGTWTNGVLNGKTTIRFRNKNLYIGEFDNGLHGNGKLTYSDGSIYSGNFNRNNRSGYGEMVYIFGLTYKGNWVSNEVDGQGQFYLTSGQVKIAEGTWKTDKTNPNDSKFISSDGLMVCFYANKNLYYGKVQDGIPSGAGIMKYANGDVYEGNFEKGIYHGNGRLKLKDNSEYTGEWKNGKKDGFGTLTKADKSVVKGYWKDDSYLGAEIPSNKPKIILVSEKCESNSEGDIDFDGFIMTGNCDKGLREGEWKELDSEGKIMASINYKNGIKDGYYIRYDNANRKISSKQFYKDGLLQGYKYVYNEEGLIMCKIKFTNGLMDSAYYYNINFRSFNKNEYYVQRVNVLDTAILKYEQFVKFNFEYWEYGRYKEYYSNGKLKEEGFSIGHNDNYGKLSRFEISGKKISEETFPSIEDLITEPFSPEKKEAILNMEKSIEKTYYPSGKIKTTASYREHIVYHYDGENKEAYHYLDGEIKAYYENGATLISAIFKENQLVGKLNYYLQDGTIKSFTLEEIYDSNDEKLKDWLHQISRNLY